MTIKEALDSIDALKPNTYEEGEKLRWLSTLDARIHRDVVLTHEHNAAAESFAGYTAQTDRNTELLVGPRMTSCTCITWNRRSTTTTEKWGNTTTQRPCLITPTRNTRTISTGPESPCARRRCDIFRRWRA